jgi:hypothetical protein
MSESWMVKVTDHSGDGVSKEKHKTDEVFLRYLRSWWASVVIHQ